MRVDIFKREEASGIYSYLLIPEGKTYREKRQIQTGNSMRKEWTLT